MTPSRTSTSLSGWSPSAGSTVTTWPPLMSSSVEMMVHQSFAELTGSDLQLGHGTLLRFRDHGETPSGRRLYLLKGGAGRDLTSKTSLVPSDTRRASRLIEPR